MDLFDRLRKIYRRYLSRTSKVNNPNNLEVVFGDDQNNSFNTSVYVGLQNSSASIKQRLIGLLIVAFVVIFVLVAQFWRLQIAKGQGFAVRSKYNTLSSRPLFAPRGAITDSTGTTLAWSNKSSSTAYYKRQYATSSGLGHVLGYVSYPQRDSSGHFFRLKSVGQAGVEAGYNRRLSSQPGKLIFETNAAGQVVSESVVRDPRPGHKLQLSIDSQLQSKLFSLLQRAAREQNFVGGAGAIMNIDTGELVAAASYPGFDPNKIMRKDDYLRQLQSATNSPFLNRVAEGQFTPGSIVKPFMAAAALNENIISPQTTIVSTGELRVPTPNNPGQFTVFKDWKAHGPVQMREAIAVSSNVYFYQIGGGFEDQAGLGIDNIVKYSRGFGLGQKTGIKGFSEAAGVIPTPAWKKKNFANGEWHLGDTYNTAIGQYGYQITPLQMVRAVSGIATGGQLVTPTLKQQKTAETTPVTPRIDEQAYQVVREGMRMAVTSKKGTAHNLDVDFASIAAKTGTAERGGKDAGVNSWITGFWPTRDPQYAFTVVMSRGPRSNLVGGLYVMRRLLEWMERNRPRYLPNVTNASS